MDIKKRLMAILLVVAMCASLLATTAFADEAEELAPAEEPTHEHNEDGWVCELTYSCGGSEHIHSDACYAEEIICGFEESEEIHTHTDDCWQITCGKAGHVHTDDCWTVCEIEEHIHDDACILNGCGKEEHIHSSECRELICELEEHVHDEFCGSLTCGKEESDGCHAHTEACFEDRSILECNDEDETHVHNESCYVTVPVLTCRKSEEPHYHTDACKARTGELVCGKEEHIHTAECEEWNCTAPAVVFNGETSFGSLQEAVNAAASGDFLELCADTTLTAILDVPTNITLFLNCNTLTLADGGVFIDMGASLKIYGPGAVIGDVAYFLADGFCQNGETGAIGTHEMVETDCDATCEQAGTRYIACANCGASTTEAAAALGHVWGDWTVTTEATCEAAGEETRTCANCEETETREIEILAHTWSEEGVMTLPTCDAEGCTTYTCTACGATETRDVRAALGHAYEAVVTAPTCGVAGYTTYTCTVCGDSYEADPTEALEHDYKETVVAPTCGVAGYTEHVCALCGDTYTDNETAALVHDWSDWDVQGDVCGGQTKARQCATCGTLETEILVDGAGHDYGDWEPMDEADHCKICKNDERHVVTEAHAWDDGERTEPTATVDGKIVYTCAVCGGTRTEVLPATGAPEAPSGGETGGSTGSDIGGSTGGSVGGGEAESEESGEEFEIEDEETPLASLPGGVFEDVAEDFWGHKAIMFVAEKHLMNGTSDTKFAPNVKMSRQMLMTVLGRMDGEDISGSKWAEKGMAWAVKNGISDGTNGEQNVTREQLVTMLYRYAVLKGIDVTVAADASLAGFADGAKVSGYAQEAMLWAVSTGIIQGSNGALDPQGLATRAQVATVLMRFCELIEK